MDDTQITYSLLFLSPIYIIISVPPLLHADIIAPGTILCAVSPVSRSSAGVYYIILIPSKEILWKGEEIQLAKGMGLYTA